MLKDFECWWGDDSFEVFNETVRRGNNKCQIGIHPTFIVASALDPQTKNLTFLVGNTHNAQINNVWKFIKCCLKQQHGHLGNDDNTTTNNNDYDTNTNTIIDIDDDDETHLSSQEISKLSPSFRHGGMTGSERQFVNHDDDVIYTTTNEKDEFMIGLFTDDIDEEDDDCTMNDIQLDKRIDFNINNYRNEASFNYWKGTYKHVKGNDGNYKRMKVREAQDPLKWWKERQHCYPMLAALARIILCIPATFALSERIFSTATNIITNKRTSLDPEIAGDMIFLNQSLN